MDHSLLPKFLTHRFAMVVGFGFVSLLALAGPKLYMIVDPLEIAFDERTFCNAILQKNKLTKIIVPAGRGHMLILRGQTKVIRASARFDRKGSH